MSARMMEQLDILAAIDRAAGRKNLGIERSSARAERTSPGWQGRALEHLTNFIECRRRLASHTGESCALEFLAEEFVRYSEAQGLASPPDGRAYGAVMQSACRRGLIAKAGYRLALSSNMSPKCLWKAAAQ